MLFLFFAACYRLRFSEDYAKSHLTGSLAILARFSAPLGPWAVRFTDKLTAISVFILNFAMAPLAFHGLYFITLQTLRTL